MLEYAAATSNATNKITAVATDAGDTVTITPTAAGVKNVSDTAENNNTFTYVLTNAGQYSNVTDMVKMTMSKQYGRNPAVIAVIDLFNKTARG